MAGHVHPFQRGRVEPAAQPRAQLGSLHDAVEPRQVDDIYAAALGQRLEQRRPPAPGPREAVHEDERLSGSGHSVSNRPAVDLDFS
jgi:hypothetical protein